MIGYFLQGIGAAALIASIANGRDTNGDEKRSFQEMCVEYGFQFEEHTVVTEDNYILTVWRIPGLQNEASATTPKPAVLFQHGVLDSANCWIMHWDDVAPAFVAARAGYDVWLGNSRGNTYSLGHTEYDHKKNEKKYWAFDWEQMGRYDIPAVIEHIVTSTTNEKIAYIGHSQGTTQMYYGLAEMQEYYDSRLNIFVALGPVTKITNEESNIIGLAAHFYDEIDFFAGLFGIHAVLQRNFITNGVCKLFCSTLPWLCELIEYFFVSHDIHADDKDRFGVYMSHEPNGSSLQSIMLYAQNMKQNRFQVWAPDYNTFAHIGQHRNTDLIPIDQINTQVPIAMFVGKDDTLATQTDAEWTKEQIGDAVIHYSLIEGGHLSFMVGKDMSYFTTDVMNLLAEYHPLPSVDSVSADSLQ